MLLCCLALSGCTSKDATASAVEAPPAPIAPVVERSPAAPAPASAHQTAAEPTKAGANADAGGAEPETLSYEELVDIISDRKLKKLKPEQLLAKLSPIAPALAESKKTDSAWVFTQIFPQKSVEVLYAPAKRGWELQGISIIYRSDAEAIAAKLNDVRESWRAQGKRCTPEWCIEIETYAGASGATEAALVASKPELD